jgi:hypothetical protein
MIEPDYITEEPHGVVDENIQDMEECVRRHPGTSILATIIAGVAVGLLVRALWPQPKPQHRALRLLDEIESRLRDLAGPPLRKASHMAGDQIEILGNRLRKSEAGLEKTLRQVGKRVSNLFS